MSSSKSPCLSSPATCLGQGRSAQPRPPRAGRSLWSSPSPLVLLAVVLPFLPSQPSSRATLHAASTVALRGSVVQIWGRVRGAGSPSFLGSALPTTVCSSAFPFAKCQAPWVSMDFYLFKKQSKKQPSVVVHTCNPCTQEAEAGGLLV
jgi:hypothetical protein